MLRNKCNNSKLLLLLVFFLSFSDISHSQKIQSKRLSPSEIAKSSLPSVVMIVVETGNSKTNTLGSGFFVKEDIVATNFHVIKGARNGYAKIVGKESKYEVLGIVGIDKENDLALLKLKGVKGKPLLLSPKGSVSVGDEVFAVGNPKGLEGTFSQGIVSSIRKENSINLIQITAAISPGSSGGPVIDEKGKVIGIASGAIESGQSLNFAIPVSFLKVLLNNISNIQPLGLTEIELSAVPMAEGLLKGIGMVGYVVSFKEYEFRPTIKFNELEMGEVYMLKVSSLNHEERSIKEDVYWGKGSEYWTQNSDGKLLRREVKVFDNSGAMSEALYYDGDGTLETKNVYSWDKYGDGFLTQYLNGGKFKDVRRIRKYKDQNGAEIKDEYANALDSSYLLTKEVTYRNNQKKVKVERYFYSISGPLLTTIEFDPVSGLMVRMVTDKNIIYEYSYEFDSVGNWIKSTTAKLVYRFGKAYLEPDEIVLREIIYGK